MYILAHDLGTSGNKATLFDESGLLVASRTAAYPTDYASGNRAEQNPHHWWKAIVDTTQALLELVSPNDIAGVALSGQMMGCLCVDKNGQPLRPHMLYCDQRSQEEEGGGGQEAQVLIADRQRVSAHLSGFFGRNI